MYPLYKKWTNINIFYTIKKSLIVFNIATSSTQKKSENQLIRKSFNIPFSFVCSSLTAQFLFFFFFFNFIYNLTIYIIILRNYFSFFSLLNSPYDPLPYTSIVLLYVIHLIFLQHNSAVYYFTHLYIELYIFKNYKTLILWKYAF